MPWCENCGAWVEEEDEMETGQYICVTCWYNDYTIKVIRHRKGDKK